MSAEQGGGPDSVPSGVRVLVVDDDPAICRQVASGLAAAGYVVVTAHDGAAAFPHAENSPPDVAIVDLEMPTSGLILIRKLKQAAGPSVHIIVMTGHDDEQHRRDAFEAGTDDFLVKPAAMADIKRRLTAAIRKQRAFVEVRLAKEAADRQMAYGAEASAMLAHDLNNALASALSNLHFVNEGATLDRDYADALTTTIRSLRRMSSLVANFVDVGRFEDAAVKPTAVMTSVRQFLSSVLEINAASFARGITMRIECSSDLEARFDPTLVERVLHNLVGNAARYCNSGGEIVVSAGPWEDPGSLQITVLNTGPPVAEDVQENLFSKYVRGAGGKRGMGLYFCRLVSEAHGGRIDYTASPQGPAFTLSLPGRT